jgi:hypothetical protein
MREQDVFAEMGVIERDVGVDRNAGKLAEARERVRREAKGTSAGRGETTFSPNCSAIRYPNGVAPILGTVSPPVAITNDVARTAPCVVATRKASASRVTDNTTQGIRQTTPPRRHSASSMRMICSDEPSQNNCPSFFS